MAILAPLLEGGLAEGAAGAAEGGVLSKITETMAHKKSETATAIPQTDSPVETQPMHEKVAALGTPRGSGIWTTHFMATDVVSTSDPDPQAYTKIITKLNNIDTNIANIGNILVQIGDSVDHLVALQHAKDESGEFDTLETKPTKPVRVRSNDSDMTHAAKDGLLVLGAMLIPTILGAIRGFFENPIKLISRIPELIVKTLGFVIKNFYKNLTTLVSMLVRPFNEGWADKIQDFGNSIGDVTDTITNNIVSAIDKGADAANKAVGYKAPAPDKPSHWAEPRGPAGPNPAVSTPKDMGSFDMQTYTDAVGLHESSNNWSIDNHVGFLGRYQQGSQLLEDAGLLKAGSSKKYGTGGKHAAVYHPDAWVSGWSIERFLHDHDIQNKTYTEFTEKNYAALQKRGVITRSMGASDVAARLMAAAEGGVVGATRYFKEGKDTKDQFLAGGGVARSASDMSRMYGHSTPKHLGPSSTQAAQKPRDTHTVVKPVVVAAQQKPAPARSPSRQSGIPSPSHPHSRDDSLAAFFGIGGDLLGYTLT